MRINKRIKINEEIRADKVRVIGSEGENLGIHPRDEAIEMARKKGLDLIEITPQAEPVVVKIHSFDKFRYEQEKKTKEKGKKLNETKRVQITPRSAKNDLETKIKQAEKFLDKGYRIEVFIFLKGREKANKEFAKGKLEEFLKMIKIPYKQTIMPKYSGRGFTTQLVKESSSDKANTS
jgi:translation initiation factor IF-3